MPACSGLCSLKVQNAWENREFLKPFNHAYHFVLSGHILYIKIYTSMSPHVISSYITAHIAEGAQREPMAHVTTAQQPGHTSSSPHSPLHH